MQFGSCSAGLETSQTLIVPSELDVVCDGEEKHESLRTGTQEMYSRVYARLAGRRATK